MPPVARCYPVNERSRPSSHVTTGSSDFDPSKTPEKFSCFKTSHAKTENAQNPDLGLRTNREESRRVADCGPDSGMRPGETNTEWRLRSLLQDLQALAAEPETLLQAFSFPGPDYVADDLAEDFGFHV